MLFGFMGVAQAGKTTAALYYAHLMDDLHNQTTAMVSMAGPLKDGLSEMGITKKDTPDLYRKAAQYIGTDIVRAHDEDWWCNLFKTRVKDCSLMWNHIAVDDVRFANEVLAVNEVNGSLFFIYTGERMDLEQPVYQHESEKLALGIHDYISTLDIDWDKVDYGRIETETLGTVWVINNTRGKDEFEVALRKCYDRITGKPDPDPLAEIKVGDTDEGLGC